jgi:hypothetical protein
MGATAILSHSDRTIVAVSDLSRASRATGKQLDSVGGVRRRSRRRVRVTVDMCGDRSPERIDAEIGGHLFACVYWDFGVTVEVQSPDRAMELRRTSAIELLRRLVRRRA